MKSDTNRESFILKPSTVSGVGVYMLHDVAEGTYMEVFLDDFEEEIRSKEDVPEELQSFCLGQKDGKLLCPKYFNSLDIGNYLNHSENANLRYEKGKGYFAARDIQAGEELFANYKELGEPEDSYENYIKNN